MKIQNLEEFDIWKLAIELSTIIYEISNKGKFERDFGLRDQMRRSAVSISSNIAEGFERDNNTEFIRYLKIAKGSCGELRSQLQIAKNIGYVEITDFDRIKSFCVDLGKRMGALIQYLSKNKVEGNFKKK